MDVLPYFVQEKNIELFTRHKVFTAEEMHSRYEIMVENYCKTLHIEALTLIDMIKGDILPAAFRQQHQLASTLAKKKNAVANISCKAETETLSKLASLTDQLYDGCEQFRKDLTTAENIAIFYEQGIFYKKTIAASLEDLRSIIDEMEGIIPAEIWPFPTYFDLLFSVN